MEGKLFRPHYDKEFKRKVIEEYLATGLPKMYLIRKYNIHFKSAIQTWMRILGYTDPYKGQQSFKFEKTIIGPLPRESKPPDKSVSELQRKIRDLERQLLEEKLRSEAYARVIEKAEKEFKIPIRKKLNTK